jgi:hypothetical protein
MIQQRFPGRMMAEERGVVHAGFGSDLADRDLLERFAFEQREQRVPQRMIGPHEPRVART